MSRHHAIALGAFLTLAGGFSPTAAHAANACVAAYQAGIKSIQTPHHVYSTTTQQGGKPQVGEAIFDGKSEYLLFHGKWRRSAMPQQVMVEAAQDKLKMHPDTCILIGDQVANGHAVTVYKVHDKEMGTDQTVRIFKSSGLMQGATTTRDGATIETRYDYDNVIAPAGVQ